MINRFLLSLILMVFLSVPAQAQRCDVDYELILNMNEGNLGSYNIWDTVFGEREFKERFKSGFLLQNDNVLVAGELFGELEAVEPSIILSEIKRNGRPAWDKRHKVDGFMNVVKMLPHPKGAIVLGNRKVSEDVIVPFVAVFDLKGALVFQNDLNGKRKHAEAFDIADLKDGTFMVAMSAKVRKSDPSSTLLFIVSQDGKIKSDRSIVTGYENRLIGLDVLPSGNVLGTGYISDANKRKSGWVLNLNPKGDILWQRQYPRGAGAQLEVGRAFLNNTLVVLGTALPLHMDKNRAAWVMVIDATTGVEGWQRYYAGSLGFVGRDLMINEDGLMSILIDGEVPLNADNVVEDQKQHVRLLTLNPRGVLFASDEYFNGEAVDAHEIIVGPKQERIIVGSTEMVYKVESEEGDVESEIVRSENGWLAAGTSMEPYDDPCVIPTRVLP